MSLLNTRPAKAAIFTIVSFFALIIISISSERIGLDASREVIPGIAEKISALHDGSSQDVHALSKIIIGKKVATIIENRPLENLVPLILQFSSVLGPEWPIVVFTAPIPPLAFKAAPFVRLINAGRIHIVPLPEHVQFADSVAVSTFLTSPWVWEQLAPADHVLLFQADSVLCSKAEHRVDDFIEYDFVGAPIVAFWGEGYNGGLSLRNRNMMLSIIAQSNFTAELEQHSSPDVIPAVEDQWYYKKMIALPPKEDGSPGAHLPNPEVAATFVVEATWNDHPLGFHQVSRWQADKLDQVDKWCPEWRLVKEGFYL